MSKVTREDLEEFRGKQQQGMLEFLGKAGATREQVAKVYARSLRNKKQPKLALEAARDLAKMYGSNGDLATSTVKVLIAWADKPQKD